MWKGFIKDYLTFSRKDRLAILLLIGIFIIVIIAPKFISTTNSPDIKDSASIASEIRSLISDSGNIKNDLSYNTFKSPDDSINIREYNPTTLFLFDPNSISINEWEQLGVKKHVALTIKKYLSKGGKFRRPEDLFKIYTLDKAVASRLIPYVRIKNDDHDYYVSESKVELTADKKITESKETDYPRKRYTEIEINSADTSQFMRLPGIGNWRAKSIVRYRESLGGFISVDQLREVRALPDSVFQKILPYLKIETTSIKKININTATSEEFLRHPYFTPEIVKSLVQYRKQHGEFKTINDLLNLHIISADFFNKIRYYLFV